MKISVIKEKCIGCGACEALAPAFFHLKDGKAVVIKQPKGKKDEDLVKDAAASCPTEAITIK